MDQDARPLGGSIVVREAPHGAAGGGLLYLARRPDGQRIWVGQAAAAEVHASLREASRAALLAPRLQGALRPAYAVPASVANADDAPVTARPRPYVITTEPAAGPAPPAPAAPANNWLWSVWAPWFAAWRRLLFREGEGTGGLPTKGFY